MGNHITVIWPTYHNHDNTMCAATCLNLYQKVKVLVLLPMIVFIFFQIKIFFLIRIDRITPLLRELHWLPVWARVNYKILTLVHKVLNGCGPAYLSNLLVPNAGRTRSTTLKALQTQKKTSLETVVSLPVPHAFGTISLPILEHCRNLNLKNNSTSFR